MSLLPLEPRRSRDVSISVESAGTRLTSGPLRLLLLGSSTEIGGGNRSLLSLAKELKRRGHALTVVSPGEGPLDQACREQSLDVVVMPWRANQNARLADLLAMSWRWLSLIRERSIDIVHANDLMGGRSVALACRLTGRPLVCHIRFSPDPALIDWAFRRLPKPHSLIFNSHSLAGDCGPGFRRALPRTEQHTIHNGVDLDEFNAQPRRDGGPFRIAIIANLLPVKGHRDFLMAARRLLDRGRDAEFWIVGEDIHGTGYRQELERYAEEIGVSEKVRFWGHRSDVAQLLTQVDVVACSSHVEPFGRCVIESMASGRPIAATRVGGIPEIVTHDETGLLSPAHDPDALAKNLDLLLNDQDLRDRLAKAGRRAVVDRFSHTRHADLVEQVYARAIRR